MRFASAHYARRGSAHILAVILLAVFASLAASLASEASMSLHKANNSTRVHVTQLEAESGLAYLSLALRQIVLPPDEGQTMLDNLAEALQARLNGTANLAGQSVGYDGTTITVPMISTGEEQGFWASITLNSDGTVRLSVTGQEHGLTRGVRMHFAPVATRSAVCDTGVASKGKLTLGGGSRIGGVNDPSEASVLSATYSFPEAASLTGTCQIDGDLYISNPAAYVTMTGNVSVGGESSSDPGILDHVHIGAGDVQFPAADTSVFEAFATNTMDASTPLTEGMTLTNVRILANTNPNFSGDTHLLGVVFIETPNRVTFTGQVTITGVIVTQDAGEGALDDNYIRFSGGTTSLGVENLPDEPQFAGLKQLPGTFILAPGFAVKFSGNFGTINGTMAADTFEYAGTAGGTVDGWVIGWGQGGVKLGGDTYLNVDRSGLDELPRGFKLPLKLSPAAGSYEEF
jgi:hypothetical protein